MSKKRIHFLTDVTDHGAAYECQRCGHITSTDVEMYEHRKGILTSFFLQRLKQRFTATDKEI